MTKIQRNPFVILAKQDRKRYADDLNRLTLKQNNEHTSVMKEPVRARTPYMFFVRHVSKI